MSIHDLSFEHLPETFNRRSRTQLRFTVRRSARRAARVLALSEYARNDIIATYRIAPDLVTAIPIAAPAHFRPVDDETELQRVRQTYGINGDYILSVGSIQPRKNLARLLAAYERLRRTRPKDKPAATCPRRKMCLALSRNPEGYRGIRNQAWSSPDMFRKLICRRSIPEHSVLFIHHSSKVLVFPRWKP